MNADQWQFHFDGTQPQHLGAVFVFGSNTAGIHGRGAALLAGNMFGAKRGVGEGLQGRSYALPTREQIAPVGRGTWLQTLPIETIAANVDRFLDFARERPDLEFFVTRIGCVLAGHRDDQIAPLFGKAPSNCSFAEQWEPFLDPASPRPGAPGSRS